MITSTPNNIMTTTPQDSETPETDAFEKAIDDFWNDPNRSPDLVESMEEAKKSGIISPLTKCRQLERRAIAAEKEFASQLKFYRESLGRVADLFGISKIVMIAASDEKHPEETYSDILIRLIKQEQDTIRSQVLKLEKENGELKSELLEIGLGD
jgi:hypothetical protein